MPSRPAQIVFIPGLLCSPRLYAPVIPAAWEFGPVTVADTRRDDRLSGIARRLLDSVAGDLALIGLSLGGYAALEVVRQAPGRVSALALLSTSARPDTAEQAAARRQQMAMVRDGHFDELVDAAFGLTVAAANADDEALLNNFRAMAREVGIDAFMRQQEAAIARPDSRDLLPRIGCPTLVMHGTGDRLIDPENGRELAAGIPGAMLGVLDDCGHSPTLERPDAVVTALTGLLSSVMG